MKTLATAIAALPLLAGGAHAGSLLSEATGAVSQILCSKHFISGLPADEVYREHLLPEPGIGIADLLIRYEVDEDRREVRARLAGGFEKRAVYREGRGCTLAFDGHPVEAFAARNAGAAAMLPEIAGPGIVIAQNPALRAALDSAFDAPGTAMTKAVVIIHNGKVIAERYAPGYGVQTPVLSHSIAKTVVNALTGILVRQGKLAVSDPAPIAVRPGPNGVRTEATVDHLLRMTAGLGFDEGSGASIASNIWYTEPDTARASREGALSAEPGTEWGYSSRSYVLLSRIIGDAAGRDPEALRDFAHRELFDPLGMENVTLEFDAAGTMMGAHAMFATPRDWARLGLLYLNDGVIGGERILPEGWVRYSTTPSGATGYGAGFWLNNTNDPMPEWRMNWGLPGVPRDAYMARGYLGQYVVVVPSENLVIAKFGVCHDHVAHTEHAARLIREVIASLPGRQALSRP